MPDSKPKSFHTKIAGVTYSNDDGTDRQKIIRRCKVGEALTLVREPGNPVDPNAIKILRQTGEQLGYISAGVASRGLTDDIDQGLDVRCSISNVTHGEDCSGVNILITVGGPVAAASAAQPTVAPPSAAPMRAPEQPAAKTPEHATAAPAKLTPTGWVIFIVLIVALIALFRKMIG
jgi:hypothetical protein